MNIAILALQGAFAEHKKMLERLGVPCFEIRKKEDLSRSFDGLILPGGESTVMGKLLRELELFEPLRERIQNGLPVMGTCAGLLLLAQHIENDPRRHFATFPAVAVRNAYGRQLGSFAAEAEFAGIGAVPMRFIRAPYIAKLLPGAQELARVNGRIVAARTETQLVTAFHPELTQSSAVHKLFLSMLER